MESGVLISQKMVRILLVSRVTHTNGGRGGGVGELDFFCRKDGQKAMRSSSGSSSPAPSRVLRELAHLADRPRLATAQEIAAATGIPIQVLYSVSRSGSFPSILIGTRMRRYDPAQVSEYLQNGGNSGGGES
jgi:hypothetical protein